MSWTELRGRSEHRVAGGGLWFRAAERFPGRPSQLEAAPDRTLFQTDAWLTFIARTQKAKPVLLELFEGEEHVGWFTGLIVQKGPVRILGSPFRGWTTPYMGFNMQSDVDRGMATRTLRDYAFERLGCVHIELADRGLTCAGGERAALRFDAVRTYELDLRHSEEDLLALMHHSPRRYIRKAARERHVVIEEAEPEGFAEEYFSQLRDLDARHSLVPGVTLDRIRALIQCLFPTGTLLLLRATDRWGQSVATGLFLGFNRLMYAWGTAGLRNFQRLHANEPLQWHAMRYWKERGMVCYDMGSGANYHQKYGAGPVERAWVVESKWRLLTELRNRVLEAHSLLRGIRGLLAGTRAQPSQGEKVGTGIDALNSRW